jgi:hypothetical protein
MALPAGVIVGSVIAHILISPLLIFGWGPMPALGPAGAKGARLEYILIPCREMVPQDFDAVLASSGALFEALTPADRRESSSEASQAALDNEAHKARPYSPASPAIT